MWIKLSNGEGGDFRKACSVPVQEGFSLHQVLVSEQDMLAWEKEEVFPDAIVLDKVLMWQARRDYNDGCAVQVIFDPHNMYDKFIRATGREDNLAMQLSSDQPDLLDLIVKGLREETPIVVHVKSLKSAPNLTKELHMLFTGSYLSSGTICIRGQEIPIPNSLYFDVVIPCSPTAPEPFVDAVLNLTPVGQITALDCSQEGLSTIFLQSLMHRMRKELCIQRRALLADLSLHKQEAQRCHDGILSRLTSSEWSGIELSDEDKSFVNEIEKVEYEALQQIKETSKALDLIKASTQPYRKLADHATTLFTICGKLAVNSPQVRVTLLHMRDMLLSLVPPRDNMRYHNSQTSLSAYLVSLANSLTKHVYQLVRVGLFKHQQLLLPLMATLDLLDPLQTDMLLHPTPLSLVSLLELRRGSVSFHDRSLHSAMLAERLPVFKELNESFMVHGPRWQEYFLVGSSK